MIASRSFRIDFRTHGRPAATKSFGFYLAIIIISAQFHIPWVVRAESCPNFSTQCYQTYFSARTRERNTAGHETTMQHAPATARAPRVCTLSLGTRVLGTNSLFMSLPVAMDSISKTRAA